MFALGIICVFFGSLALLMGLATLGSGDASFSVVFIICACLLIPLSIWCFWEAKKKKKKKNELKQGKMDCDASEVMQAIHIGGLPIASGTTCQLYLCEDKYRFQRNKDTYDLSFDKVTDVVIKSKTEVQNHYASSIGGAIAGAALAGPIGAVFGGRTKRHTDKKTESFIVFSYMKEDGKISFITFDCTHTWNARKFLNAFTERNETKQGESYQI